MDQSKSSNSSSGSSDLPFGPPDIQEIRLSFSLAEREFYDGLFQQTKAEFTGFALAGTLSHNKIKKIVDRLPMLLIYLLFFET